MTLQVYFCHGRSDWGHIRAFLGGSVTLLQLLNMCRMSVQLSEHSCKTLTDRMGQLLVLPMALWINSSLWKKTHSFLNLSLLVSKVMLLLGILPAWKGQLSALCACSALTSSPLSCV